MCRTRPVLPAKSKGVVQTMHTILNICEEFQVYQSNDCLILGMLFSVIRKPFTVITFLLMFAVARSQELNQVSFSGGAVFSYFSLLTDGNLLIRISDDGKILEWGTEEQSLRNSNYYAPKLQPYPGRVEYYGPEADSVFRGKVRSIGSASITYYGVYENQYKVGKIRSIGRQLFDYYTNFNNKALNGKIEFIGSFRLDYYSSYENEAFAGKLKALGSTYISYYSSFDDKLIRGKIKSIGPLSYSWYTSIDRPGYGGGLKTGAYRQNIGSVTYIVM
jgi:hypothetical protein